MNKLEKLALNKRFAKDKVEISGKDVIHGKVRKIITNTHCAYRIVLFKHGNIFLTKLEIQEIVKKYIDKNRINN